MHKQKSRAPVAAGDAGDYVLADGLRHESASHRRERKAGNLSGYHVINVGKRREFILIVDDTVAAIIARDDIRKRGEDLIFNGNILTPRTLREYVATICIFDNGKTQKHLAPWPVIFAVLSRAYGGWVAVRDDDATQAAQP